MTASLHTGIGRGVDTQGHYPGFVCPMKGEVRVWGGGRLARGGWLASSAFVILSCLVWMRLSGFTLTARHPANSPHSTLLSFVSDYVIDDKVAILQKRDHEGFGFVLRGAKGNGRRFWGLHSYQCLL